MSFAFLMSVSSQVVIILFFLNKFIFNSDIIYLSVILIMIILAFITELLISYLIGLIAFWADEVDGIYATVDRLKIFFRRIFPSEFSATCFRNRELFFAFRLFVLRASPTLSQKNRHTGGDKGNFYSAHLDSLALRNNKASLEKGIKKI